MADIILNKGVEPPLINDGKPRSREGFKAAIEPYVQATLSRASIVEATNVYEYCKGAEAIELYDLPCAAPTLPLIFVEFQQHNGKPIGLIGWADEGPFSIEGLEPIGEPEENGYRRLQDVEGHVASMVWLSNHLPDQASWDRVRWVWDIEVFQGDGRGRVVGPLTTIRTALDQWGRFIDVSYEYHFPATDQSLMLMPFHVFITTLNFMQCANVRTEYVDPPAALSKKHRKKGHIDRDLLRYHVLQLSPIGPDQRNRSRSTGESGVGFHIVRGEFHHHGDCCPGQHPPKGKLFGKHTGIYWVPMHSRGNPERGSIVTDYKIKPILATDDDG